MSHTRRPDEGRSRGRGPRPGRPGSRWDLLWLVGYCQCWALIGCYRAWPRRGRGTGWTPRTGSGRARRGAWTDSPSHSHSRRDLWLVNNGSNTVTWLSVMYSAHHFEWPRPRLQSLAASAWCWGQSPTRGGWSARPSVPSRSWAWDWSVSDNTQLWLVNSLPWARARVVGRLAEGLGQRLGAGQRRGRTRLVPVISNWVIIQLSYWWVS